ncbi:MAG TPA: prolipoprotein diacylglyceryl transferase family protein [Chitinophagaceae bacterium]|nr:prolipoprotein diacylglyceryl transferase family protein [Chitinophagaceae bacterium]
MKFPVYIEIGSTKILLHVVFELLAFFIGFRYFLWLRKKRGDGINTPNRTWIIIGAILGALAGSRLIGGLEDPTQINKADNLLFYFYQNKTVLGGFLGGLAGVEIVKKIIRERQASGDLFVYPIILALVIGRIGCFSMGVYEETYGTATTLPWGMNLGDGYPRHPVCLYEIIFLLVLWVCFRSVQKKFSLEQGALFKLFMIAYLGFRFLLDFIKPHYTYNIGLSTIQLTCIGGLLYYLPYIIRPKKLLASYA